MDNRMRLCDVPIGAVVRHPDTGQPFTVTFNGYTSPGMNAAGWRTLRGTCHTTGEPVHYTDIWEWHVTTVQPQPTVQKGQP